MDNFLSTILLCILTAICAAVMGWTAAHNTVAKECSTLGGFYVGESVFECKEKSK